LLLTTINLQEEKRKMVASVFGEDESWVHYSISIQLIIILIDGSLLI
jgi:chloramphenicol O-acetyltransferase